MSKHIFLLCVAVALSACSQSPKIAPVETGEIQMPAPTLNGVLASQPDEVQARYAYRHPQQTLEFFGLQPGMTVVEALPGGGWYSRILLDYLGSDGLLIGADYPMGMWPLFGFFNEEFIENKKSWVSDWTLEASGWRKKDSATVSAFVMGSMPAELDGTADAVLFIRALHNLRRFEDQGGFFSAALMDAHRALKPGGILGVVQHQAPDRLPDEWADGSHGYLKKDDLIARIEAAGFRLLASSDINANPMDQPTETDVVWRLPPTLVTSREDEELKAKMIAIGESNRMTLKFKKP